MTRHINLLIDTLARYKESASVKFGRGCILKVGLKITIKLGWAVTGNEGNGFSYHISKWIKRNFNMEKRKFRSVHMIHIIFEIPSIQIFKVALALTWIFKHICFNFKHTVQFLGDCQVKEWFLWHLVCTVPAILESIVRM